MKIKFSECVRYMIKGPFGSDMKKSLYVPKGEDTYKVYIQSNAIQQDEKLGDYYVSAEYFHQKLERFEVHPGDYIITCDGTLGKHIRLSEDIEKGVISSSLLLIKLDEEKIYDKYFELLWDNSMLAYLASQARNACLVHLPSAKAIGDVEIELPEMSVQKEIADKAFLINDVIGQRNKELQLLDDLIKARFVELFGGLEDTVRLGDCCEVHARIGWQALTRDEHMQTGEYMLVTGTDFKDGRVNYDTCVYVAKERYEMDPHIILKENDVLITKDGSIGKVAVVHDLPKPATLNGGVFVVRPDDRFNKEYISYVFRGPLFERFVDLSKTGATIKHLNQKHLVEFAIPLPSIEEQEAFAQFSKQIDKSKVAVQKALDETQLLFDSLMQQYFG